MMTAVPAELPPPPPPPPPPPVAPAQPMIDFAKPFTYVLEDPNWLPKILIGGLFYLAGIFIVGWFFILGYVARTARNIIRGDQHPLPEWDDLGVYFGEGLRLAGVVLVYIAPILAIVSIFIVPAIIVDAIDNDVLDTVASALSGCVWLMMVPFVFATMFFMPASLLFVAVEQRVGAAFEFGRIWPFIKANIANYLLAIVVYLIARFLGSVGMALCCIGVIFTAFWSFLITTHGFAQVYRLSSSGSSGSSEVLG